MTRLLACSCSADHLSALASSSSSSSATSYVLALKPSEHLAHTSSCVLDGGLARATFSLSFSTVYVEGCFEWLSRLL